MIISSSRYLFLKFSKGNISSVFALVLLDGLWIANTDSLPALHTHTADAGLETWKLNQNNVFIYLTKSWNYRNYKSFSLIQSHWRESCIKLFFQIDIFLNKETTSKVLYYLNRTTSAIVPLERSCFESFLVLILA